MSQHPLRRLAIVSAVAALALGLVSCSSVDTSGSSSAALSDSELDTVTPGVLTIATSEPAYSPYVEDDDPTTGEGFESAVAYAVAEKLGYSADEVEWVREDHIDLIANADYWQGEPKIKKVRFRPITNEAPGRRPC